MLRANEQDLCFEYEKSIDPEHLSLRCHFQNSLNTLKGHALRGLADIYSLDLSRTCLLPGDPGNCSFFDWSGIFDLSPLAEMFNLQSLNINHNGIIDDLSPISKNVKLKVLTFDYCPVNSLKPIESLINLENLSFRGTKINDLSPLKNCKKLKEIHIDGQMITDISVLAELPDIEVCSLKVSDVNDLGVLGHLKKLRELTLFGIPHHKLDLTPLIGFENLKKLRIEGINLYDLISLEKLTSIELIDLVSIPNHDIAPLAGLKNLVALTLFKHISLTDISALINLEHFEQIHLHHYCLIDDDKSLVQLKHLKSFNTIDSGISNEERGILSDILHCHVSEGVT